MKTIKISNNSTNEFPKFVHEGDSGFDLRAYITDGDGTITLKPLERKLIHTGLYVDIPKDTELQIRPRSGCALKQGLSICNTPGTVDSCYTGELGIIAINLSKEQIVIRNGDRIAQAVLCPVFNSFDVNLIEVESICKDTTRGKNGFNSTGLS